MQWICTIAPMDCPPLYVNCENYATPSTLRAVADSLFNEYYQLWKRDDACDFGGLAKLTAPEEVTFVSTSTVGVDEQSLMCQLLPGVEEVRSASSFCTVTVPPSAGPLGRCAFRTKYPWLPVCLTYPTCRLCCAACARCSR